MDDYSTAVLNGAHIIPYTQRTAIGAVRRGRGGTGPATYPDNWLVDPNRQDRYNDLMPDSLRKQP